MNKRLMKRALTSVALVLVAVAWVATPALAQHEKAHANVEEHVKMMTEHLGLTEEQATQAKEILTAHMASDDHSMEALHEALTPILTDEQKEKMAAMHSRHEKMRRGDDKRQRATRTRTMRTRTSRDGARRVTRSRTWNSRGGQRGAMRSRSGRDAYRGWAPQSAQLRLSREQMAELAEIRREAAAARQTFAEENPEATREERRAFAEAQAMELREAMESVLTVEQKLMRMRLGERQRRQPSGLNLSEEQEAQIEEALSAHREAHREWVEANPEASRADRAAQAGEQRSALESALEEILTPEQMEALDSRSRRQMPRGRRATQRRWR